jgi:thiosulfate dehydrogenase [quinone] large subunit
MNDSNATKPGETCNCDYTLAFLILRGWLAVRALLTGIEKFGAYQSVATPVIDPATGQPDASGVMMTVNVKHYAFANYSGIPTGLKGKFAYEPLLPHSLLSLFDHLLGPVLIATGLMLLLGLGTRISLFIQGLLYIMLTVGLIIIKQDDGISWLGIHVALVAFALVLARHNKLAILKKW